MHHILQALSAFSLARENLANFGPIEHNRKFSTQNGERMSVSIVQLDVLSVHSVQNKYIDKRKSAPK